MYAGRLDSGMDEGMSWMVLLGYLGAILLGIFGALLGGCVGFFMGQGANTIIGSASGFALFFLLGCCLLGPAKSMFNNMYAEFAPPEMGRLSMLGGYKTFEVYVTVHNVQNVISAEGVLGFLGKKNNSFLQIKVGRLIDDDDTFIMSKNPPKRTCVRENNIFEEVFCFVIEPTDDTIEVTLYDQDLIGEDRVGTCYISITDDVLGRGFPQKMGFKLLKSSGFSFFGKASSEYEDMKTGIAILSFQPGKNFPGGTASWMARSKPFASYDLVAAQTKLVKGAEKEDYGTWATTTGVRDLENGRRGIF